MSRLRYTAGVSAAIVLVGLAPATSASAAGQYGDVRPTAILRTVGGSGTSFQGQGQSSAVSADGDTVIVGGGMSQRGGRLYAGHVYIWVRTDDVWHQQATLSPPASDPPSRGFGTAVSLSADGRYLAVGDPMRPSSPGADDDAGAVYLYARTASGWALPTTLPDPGKDLYDSFGSSLAISADGSALVVGSPSNGTPSTVRAGWAFERTPGGWGPAQPLPVPPGLSTVTLGVQVALSGDGRRAAVTNTYGDLPGAAAAGDVLTFDRNDAGTWTAGAVLSDQPPTATGEFGYSLAMSSDGSTLVVGSAYAYSSLRSRVAVFRRDTGAWVRSAQFFASTSSRFSYFGSAVAVSAAGDVVAVGAPFHDTATAYSVGAVHRYGRTGTSWSYLGVTRIKGAGAYEDDGWSVALAGNTGQLFIGAPGYARSDRPGARSGAVYVIG